MEELDLSLPVAHWTPPLECYEYPTKQAVEDSAAMAVHILLFSGRFVVGDSYILNSPILRRLIRTNGLVRHLIESGHFQVAFREIEGEVASSRQVLRHLVDSGGLRPEASWRLFKKGEELEFIDSRAIKLVYSLQDAEKYYTSAILEFFEEFDFGDWLPREVSKVIYNEAITERERSGGSLGHAFFARQQNLGALLDARFPGKQIWHRYGEFIGLVSYGPHMTYLTEKFYANPHYSPERRQVIDLWRCRLKGLGAYEGTLTADELCRVRISSKLDGASFVRGLVSLQPEDVDNLIYSEAAERYTTAMGKLDGRLESEREVVKSYGEYRRRVEETILSRLGSSVSRDEELEVRLSLLKRIGAAARKASEQLLLEVIPVGGVASSLKLGFEVVSLLVGREDKLRRKQLREARENLLVERYRADIALDRVRRSWGRGRGAGRAVKTELRGYQGGWFDFMSTVRAGSDV